MVGNPVVAEMLTSGATSCTIPSPRQDLRKLGTMSSLFSTLATYPFGGAPLVWGPLLAPKRSVMVAGLGYVMKTLLTHLETLLHCSANGGRPLDAPFGGGDGIA